MMALLFWVFSCKIIVVYALISSPGYIFNMVFLHHNEEYEPNLYVTCQNLNRWISAEIACKF